MSKEQLQQLAEDYARETTHARCAKMGDCDKCNLRYCDYKSRIDAFLYGWSHCLTQLQLDCDEDYKRLMQGFSYKSNPALKPQDNGSVLR